MSDPIGFTVSSSIGLSLYWLVCGECGLLDRYGTEDEAVAAGMDHVDELHPERTLDTDQVRAPLSVHTTLARGVVVTRCFECELVIHEGPASEVQMARAAAADHVASTHPWQVWTESVQDTNPRPEGPGRPDNPGPPEDPGRPDNPGSRAGGRR